MKSLASEWFDDVPTGVIETLGSLIAHPAIAVAIDTAEVTRMLLEHRVPAASSSAWCRRSMSRHYVVEHRYSVG